MGKKGEKNGDRIDKEAEAKAKTQSACMSLGMLRVRAGQLAGRLVGTGNALACPANGRASDEQALSYDRKVSKHTYLYLHTFIYLASNEFADFVVICSPIPPPPTSSISLMLPTMSFFHVA